MIKVQTEKNNMKVYRFKCEDCGSKQYDKLDETTYRCSYCGRTEELYFKKEQQEEQEESQKMRL